MQRFGDATADPKAWLDGVHHTAILFQLVNDDASLQLLEVAVKLVLQPQVDERCNKSTRTTVLELQRSGENIGKYESHHHSKSIYPLGAQRIKVHKHDTRFGTSGKLFDSATGLNLKNLIRSS